MICVLKCWGVKHTDVYNLQRNALTKVQYPEHIKNSCKPIKTPTNL